MQTVSEKLILNCLKQLVQNDKIHFLRDVCVKLFSVCLVRTGFLSSKTVHHEAQKTIWLTRPN
jgi:uncharacterized membrane protein